MPVPSTIADLSTTAASNSPAGSESPNTVDDYIRAHAAIIKTQDATDVKLTGDQTISGVKTFNSAPLGVTAGLGDNSTKLATTAFVLANSAPTPGYMLVQDQKAVGANGGTSAAGVQTRALNTVSTNTIAGASLASNQITLPAGTYRFRGSAPAHNAEAHKLFLYSVTGAVGVMGGTSERMSPASLVQTRSLIAGRLTLAATTVLELRHQIGTGAATNGLGVATNVAASGVEIYSELEIFKEA